MSAILYLGTKKALGKVEYGAGEVFSEIAYPSSLFFRDGIAFDGVCERDGRRIGRYFAAYKWYEVKSCAPLFDCESKNRDVCPDLYEASRQLGEWFLRFLSAEIERGNEICLLRRWLGDPDDKKIDHKTLKTSSLKPTDCKLPYDTLIRMRL